MKAAHKQWGYAKARIELCCDERRREASRVEKSFIGAQLEALLCCYEEERKNAKLRKALLAIDLKCYCVEV